MLLFLGFSACNTNKQSGVETTKASTVATEVEKDSVKSVVDEAIPTQKVENILFQVL